MLFQVYDVSHTLCRRMQAKKCKVRKIRGSQNGDFIDIKNDLVCKSRDRFKPKSAICFLPVSLDPGERYSCCANISNLRQHLWHMLAASLPAKESKSSSTKWTKFSGVQRLFATPNGRKSKQEYSIIIENSRNRIMFLWPFVLFNSEASFSKQDFESMDSTLFFLATTFFWSFLCILLGIRTQTYRNPTYFLFRKVSTQTLATPDPFLPLFSDLLGF